MEQLHRDDYQKALTVTGVIRDSAEISLRECTAICYDMVAKRLYEEMDAKLEALLDYMGDQI